MKDLCIYSRTILRKLCSLNINVFIWKCVLWIKHTSKYTPWNTYHDPKCIQRWNHAWHRQISSFYDSVLVFVLFTFLCVSLFLVFFLCLSSSCILCTQCCQCLLIIRSWLALRFSLTFIPCYYIALFDSYVIIMHVLYGFSWRPFISFHLYN
jgi:hypothetical protein